MRLPKWLRIGLVCAAVALATGIGVAGYRLLTRPTTLTVATGSIDGDSARLMSALATRLSSSNASIRLKIIDKGTAVAAAHAFSEGEVDLAIVRDDIGDLSSARTVVLVAHGVLLIVVPPGNLVV